MNAEELRAAAETAVRCYDAREYHDMPAATVSAVIIEAARAYLADRPADDAEPVTLDWLRSVGFKDYMGPDEWCEGYVSFWLDRREHNTFLLAVHWARPGNPAGHFWSANGFTLYRPAHPKTRGDVRRLLKLLGGPAGVV